MEFTHNASTNEVEDDFIKTSGFGDKTLIFDYHKISETLLHSLEMKGVIYRYKFHYYMSDLGLTLWNKLQNLG